MPRHARSRSSTPEFQYRQPRMDCVEDVEKYVPGGYHPIDIGDEIGTVDGSHRYTVLHKLGSGGFSTVWLVRSRHDMLYFALKVLVAETLPGSTECNELRILEHLQRDGHQHPNVIKLHSSFEIAGPNGRHVCLLLPVLGPSLGNLDVCESLSPATRYRVCRQAASGVTFLHERGVCHGDLTPSNIVFAFPNTFFLNPSQVCHLLGPIRTEKLKLPNGTYSPHAPKRVVQAPDFSGLEIPRSLVDVQIVDLGAAFFIDSPPSSLGVPMSFFPLELCFGYSPSPMSDVWELACVIFEVLGNTRLFKMFFPIYEMLIGTAMPILGPLPPKWRECFDNERYGYREGGHLKSNLTPDWWFGKELHTKTIRGQLESFAPHLAAGQREAVAQIVEEMLEFEPAKRLSSAEVEQRLIAVSSMFDAALAVE